MKKPIIELRDVWKTYRMEETEVNALRGVSLTINEDEFVSIQGPSGSGKSTLMHLVGCLDLPTKGQVLLDGHDISRLDESELATIRGKRIGFVFQAFNLIPTLTAKENVMLPMLFNNVPRWKREQAAKELLADIGLKERMDHKPNQLSGGEQQRVAIARSLANDPEVILADEPTGNLDSNTGKHIMDLIMHLSTVHKKTIIMVTHDPYIAGFAKKKIVIVDGQVGHDHEYLKKILWRSNHEEKHRKPKGGK
ncbi:MAG: ABC transporter ATP-binding protein [Nanoarchaeota archaeon]